MARPLLTLSGFALGAAAGVAALVVRPLPAAGVAIVALALAFAALQSLRDGEVEDDTRRAARDSDDWSTT